MTELHFYHPSWLKPYASQPQVEISTLPTEALEPKATPNLLLMTFGKAIHIQYQGVPDGWNREAGLRYWHAICGRNVLKDDLRYRVVDDPLPSCNGCLRSM